MMSCDVTSVGSPHHVALPYRQRRGCALSCHKATLQRSVVWHRPIGSPHYCSRPYEWLIGSALHCVRLSARLIGLNGVAGPHILQCLSGKGALVTRERVNLATCLGQINLSLFLSPAAH
jgi:hypothetical protein